MTSRNFWQSLTPPPPPLHIVTRFITKASGLSSQYPLPLPSLTVTSFMDDPLKRRLLTVQRRDDFIFVDKSKFKRLSSILIREKFSPSKFHAPFKG